jgi:serine/threonine protein kinase
MSSKYDDDRDYSANNSIPTWANVPFHEIEVGDRIGGGGVGIIYRGTWKRKPVALKTLFDPRISNSLKQEYMDELLVMSRVDHSNIVKFLGACMTPPNLCFIMELCECSLYDMLHKDRIRMGNDLIFQAAVGIYLIFDKRNISKSFID